MDAATASHLIFGLNPQIVATIIVVICYLILFSEKLNRAVVA